MTKLSKLELRQQGIDAMNEQSTLMQHGVITTTEFTKLMDKKCDLIIGLFPELMAKHEIRDLLAIANTFISQNAHVYLKLSLPTMFDVIPYLVSALKWKVSTNLINVIHKDVRISIAPKVEADQLSYHLVYARTSERKLNISCTDLIHLEGDKDYERLISKLILRSGKPNEYMLNLSEGSSETVLAANKNRMHSIAVINNPAELLKHSKTCNSLNLTNS